MIISTFNPKRLLPLLVLVLALFPIDARATDTIVSPKWVAAHLRDPDVVLLHVGDKETFERGHIPGAQHVNAHMDFSHPDSHSDDNLILEMPSTSTLKSTLERLGVSDDSKIIVYWSDEEITVATRVVFTLQWAGLGDQTYYLDGGLDAWKAADNKLTDSAVSPEPGSLTLSTIAELVVGAEWIQANVSTNGVALVDGRSHAFFDGVSESRGKEGHIPGARSTPWTNFVDHDLKLKDSEAIWESFAIAGVEPGDTVVAYCHIGQYATMVLLAASSVGYDIKLYDGAFQDWAVRDLPVTTE